MKFGPAKEAEMYKKLATMSAAEVGYEYKFDTVYPNRDKIRTAVSNIKTKVQNNLEDYKEFGVTPEVVDLVKVASESRSIMPVDRRQAMQKLEIDSDIVAVVVKGRDTVFNLMNKKLDIIAKSKKELKKISLKELGVAGGILFDKAQILRGEATENIAVMAKIDKNMSPDDALQAVSKIRENNSVKNDLRKK